MTVLDKSLLDTPIEKINFTELDPLAELRLIAPRFMQVYDQAKQGEKVFVLRSYDVQTPTEATLIQMALDKIERIKLSVTEESKVRQEMTKMIAQGLEIDSPEVAAKWEAKLHNARMVDKAALEKIKDDRASKLGGHVISVSALDGVQGLGAKSVQKLLSAGIKTPEEFFALSHEQRVAIVGSIVAATFNTPQE